MGNLYVQIGLLLVVFVVFLILPKQRELKKEKDFEGGLKVGDKVVTKSGFHGKITELGDKTAVIETMAGKLKIEKSAISSEMSSALNKK